MFELRIANDVILVNKGFIWWTGKESGWKSFRDREGEKLIIENFLDCKSVSGVFL